MSPFFNSNEGDWANAGGAEQGRKAQSNELNAKQDRLCVMDSASVMIGCGTRLQDLAV